MKIEAGKKYKDRQGAEIQILRYLPGDTYPYVGMDAEKAEVTFCENGRYYWDTNSEYDLVEEVIAERCDSVHPKHGQCDREAGHQAPCVVGPAFVEPPAASTDTYDPPRLWNLLRTTWRAGTVLPDNSAQRKEFPIAEGFDNYFPAAIVAVAGWSRMANNKHNPGQPLNHARGKSADHADCQRRHQLDALDPKRDRLEELTCKAWRAMAELQEYAESLGAPAAPAATFPEETK